MCSSDLTGAREPAGAGGSAHNHAGASLAAGGLGLQVRAWWGGGGNLAMARAANHPTPMPAAAAASGAAAIGMLSSRPLLTARRPARLVLAARACISPRGWSQAHQRVGGSARGQKTRRLPPDCAGGPAQDQDGRRISEADLALFAASCTPSDPSVPETPGWLPLSSLPPPSCGLWPARHGCVPDRSFSATSCPDLA